MGSLSPLAFTTNDRALEQIERELAAIRSDMLAVGRFLRHWNAVPESHLESARNLLHYLTLRRHDVRALQLQLASRGLSSLGRAEAQALASVEAVLGIVRCLARVRLDADRKAVPAIDLARGRARFSSRLATRFCSRATASWGSQPSVEETGSCSNRPASA